MADRSHFVPEACIQSWSCSYYDNDKKSWLYGTLHLGSTVLYFKENSEPSSSASSEKILTIEFSKVKNVNKTLSSFLFGALTVLTNDGQTYWFSSLTDRNSTFLTIQHFLKAFLCSPNESKSDNESVSSPPYQGRTKLGTEILRSAIDSQSTLAKAGAQLVAQGEQLSNSAVTVQGMLENLSVAERLTGGLESWLGRWRMPPSKKFEELIVVNSNDIPDIMDVEALCCQLTMDKFGPRTPCVFRVGKDGVTILDMKQKIINRFKWSDVSRIRVMTPWEILVTRYQIGQPDLSYSIIYEAMPTVLTKLNTLAANKMEYMTPPERLQYARSRGNPVVTEGQQKSPSADSSNQLFYQEQTNQEVTQQVVSDAEAVELSSVLGNLKSLALDISKEQDTQLECIDHLTDSVSRADAKQKKLDFRANRIL